ncbi:hypothetical protein EW145_g4979 [Phellinidium pouzarii]|uniref:Uncharacterized protein n=1 Tax=Phellinidium pouzarii TaxID=167371 RepID=A0A4S4L302_9AGAM|nr:hypothetical protein EW145_g4979 [Phellinidium pouzarii]
MNFRSRASGLLFVSAVYLAVLPLEILRYLSEWASVPDERKVVLSYNQHTFDNACRPTSSYYPSNSSSSSVGLRSPGACLASFPYIGLFAAGEKIEQPFGYEENDLDLDLFCHDIIHADMEALKRIRCPNAYLLEDHRDGNSCRLSSNRKTTSIEGLAGGCRDIL